MTAHAHGRPLSPAVAREERRAATARALAAAIQGAGLTHTEVAAAVGVPRQRVDEWCAVDSDKHIQLADGCGTPEPVRLALAAHLAGPGYVVTALPPVAAARAADLRLAADAQREASEAVAEYLEVCADGRIGASEGRALERACDEAIAALCAVRERARLAQRERVIGVAT